MTKQRVRAAVFVVFALAVILLLVVTLHHEYADVRARLHELHAWAVVVTLATAVGGSVFSMLSWRALLADLGSPLRVTVSARIFFLGQLGKYLPGSVWSIVGQMELAKAHHVPRTRSATAAAVALVVSVLSGLLVAAALLPVLARHETAHYWPAFLALPVALALLVPRVLTAVLQWLLRLARRPPLERAVTGRGVLGSVAWSLLTWVAWGVGIWVLAREEGVGSARAFGVCVGAFALAWVAGFLVLVVPAGAGVREAVLVAVLGSALALPSGAPLLLSLVSRLALSVSDVLLGLAVLPTARRPRDVEASPPVAVDRPVRR